jgi:hypothetical protein
MLSRRRHGSGVLIKSIMTQAILYGSHAEVRIKGHRVIFHALTLLLESFAFQLPT